MKKFLFIREVMKYDKNQNFMVIVYISMYLEYLTKTYE